MRTEAACCRDAGSEVEEKGAVGIAPAAEDGGAHAAVSWRLEHLHDDGSHINNMEDSHTLNTGPRSDLFRDQLSLYLFRGKYWIILPSQAEIEQKHIKSKWI